MYVSVTGESLRKLEERNPFSHFQTLGDYWFEYREKSEIYYSDYSDNITVLGCDKQMETEYFPCIISLIYPAK